MVVGLSIPSTEDNATRNTLEMLEKLQMAQISRPLNCPRVLPPKMLTTDLAVELPCQLMSVDDECPPAKKAKLESHLAEFQRNLEFVGAMLPENTTEAVAPDQLEPQQVPCLPDARPNRTHKQGTEAAMQLFREALTAYVLEQDMKGEDAADKFGEEWAATHYEELKRSILDLLPWTGDMHAATGGAYDMIKFQGRKTARRKVCKRQLQYLRADGEQARAWEALSAVLSAISSRKEMNWLEYHDVVDELHLNKLLAKMPGCKTKRSARRREAIHELIPKMAEEGAGAFADALIDPRSLHVVTFARGPGGPVPATSMTIRRMPLWDALKTMDDDGPLRGEAMVKEWCWAAGRQFALQDLSFGPEDGSRKCAKSLKPDTQLRDLLRSKRPVVLLDTLAALAPRDVCRTNGVSDIVKAELAALFREAKANGEAVVLCLGGGSTRKLAEKVYLRPPLADYGLRCGCLRWRQSADVPWAREFRSDDRITLCLQMP